MKSLSRPNAPSSTALLMRILERPELVAAVRELPGAVLGKLIDRIGLEDAGELVALASTAQLERIFDDDLWRAERTGGDETFRPERFALWLRVMLKPARKRWCSGCASCRRIWSRWRSIGWCWCSTWKSSRSSCVRRRGGGGARARAGDVGVRGVGGVSDDRARPGRVGRCLERAHGARSRSPRSVARDSGTLLRDEPEYISGQGGLFQVLTADEMLDSDIAAARDDRRVRGRVRQPGGRAGVSRARPSRRGRRKQPDDGIRSRGRTFVGSRATQERSREPRRGGEGRPSPRGSWRRCCARRR